ncbi:MAG TPA: GNAT family N-acetyltransferase [Gaiellaceae bacterium]
MIRPLNPGTDAAGVVELIHEVFPAGTTTPESWLQQHASIPERARHADWVAIVDGTVAARAEAGLKWFSDTGSAFVGVSVHPAFRRRGIGGDLWATVRQHLETLAPRRAFTMFMETPEGVAFARARGFAEVRAETLSCVDPRRVDEGLDAGSTRLVPFRDVSAEEVYDVDMLTTPDVPMSEAVTDLPFDEWLDTIWRRPTITLDGSFAAIEDDRVVSITMLAANIERRRAFVEYTATLREYRRRGLAEKVKRASLRWAAESGIAAVWTTNDETNAAMLAINERLGYLPRMRRVEYVRDA